MANIAINLDAFKDNKQIKRHKIADGENVYRILPPNSPDLNGSPYVYYAATWGFKSRTGKPVPYADPSCYNQDRKSPVYDWFKENEAAIKRISEDKDAPKPVKDFLDNLKPRKAYYYNAVNKKGEIGVLELKTTAHQSLKKMILKYITEFNQDPTSLNSLDDDSGVWFNFKREGTGRDTEYSVTFNMVKVKQANGRTLMDYDRGPEAALPENVAQNFQSQSVNLLKDLYMKKSYKEYEELFISTLVVSVNDPNLSSYLKDLTYNGKPLSLLIAEENKLEQVEHPALDIPTPEVSSKVKLNLNSLQDDMINEIDSIC